VLGFCLTLFGMAAANAQGLSEFQGKTPKSEKSSDPRNRARIHTELGAMYFQDGNMSVALEELRIAIEADSTYFPAYSVRGLVHGYLKDYPKADDDFRQAMSYSPNDPDLNNNYGWYLCESGRETQSIGYFMAALKNPLYQTPERAYNNAGTCALRVGDIDAAERYLLQALRLARDGGPLARVQLAKLYYQRGLLEESRRYVNEAMKMMEPPSVDVLWVGLRIEKKMGNKAAEANYAALLRLRYPTSPEYAAYLKGDFQ
jgi:type IV pilus assembly protein PilF